MQSKTAKIGNGVGFIAEMSTGTITRMVAIDTKFHLSQLLSKKGFEHEYFKVHHQ
jgi:hypothetical protein